MYFVENCRGIMYYHNTNVMITIVSVCMCVCVFM